MAEIGKEVNIEAVQKRIIETEKILSKMNKERNMKSARVEVLSELITVKNTNLETMKTEEEALKTAVEAMVSVRILIMHLFLSKMKFRIEK